jgi:hypothetical protein
MTETRPVQLATMGMNLGIGFISAVITGIISGVFLRLIMEIISISFPHLERGFTIAGTASLLMLGIGFSLANSIIYTLIQSILPNGWVRKGLVYGFINLIIYGIPFFLSNPDNDLFGPQAPLGISLFSILFIIAALILAFLVDRISYWSNQSKRREKYGYFIFIVLIVPAIIMTGGIIFEIFTELIPAIQANL